MGELGEGAARPGADDAAAGVLRAGAGTGESRAGAKAGAPRVGATPDVRVAAVADAEARFEEFVGLVSALEKEICRIRAAECARIGLRGADLMVAYQLGASTVGMTAAELARRCGVTRSAVSRSVARLEAEGLARVGEGAGGTGAYRAPIRLTDEGARRVERARQAVARVMTEVEGALGPQERARMYESLGAVLGRLRALP